MNHSTFQLEQLEEVTATFLGERRNCRWGDTFIGEFKISKVPDGIAYGGSTFSIKGEASEDELVIGIDYQWLGSWSAYKSKFTGKTEKQFHFRSFVEVAPVEREGVIAYLVQAGQGRGIGAARARAIWDLWGVECVAKLRESPEEVQAAIKGLSIEDAIEASRWLNDRKKLEACTISMTQLLSGRGFRKNTARWAIGRYGNLAAQVVRRDPFRLIDSPGTGFSRCDALWTHLKLRPGKLRRQGMAAWYAVGQDRAGSTWVPYDLAKQGVANHIGVSTANPDRAIEFCLRLGNVAPIKKGSLKLVHSDMEGRTLVDGTSGRRWLAQAKNANIENRLAELVVLANQESATWPSPESIEGISAHQREQYRRATAGGSIAILGGGPGTGKTFTSAAIIKQMVQQFGKNSIAVAVPTGKAGVRLTEAMTENGLSIRARTWHSTLGIGELDRETGEIGFAHDERNPLGVKIIIGDESSMPGTGMFRSIMGARPAGCLLLIVGDINQLPPIEHGAPMRDLIAAKLPYGELTEIHRNDGGIVEACAAIRTNRPWKPEGNLQLISPNGPEGQIAELIEEINSAKEAGIDPIWDVQTVVAVNKKSPLSRERINQILQEELNPQFPTRPKGSPFAIGDKIVCTKNGFYTSVDFDFGDGEDIETNQKGEVFVANGELGEVVDIEEKRFTCRLRNPSRVIAIPRGKIHTKSSDDSEAEAEGTATGCAWDLGYALSVHKSQGSEWPWVIVMLDDYPGARMVCSREWLYTSISRAKQRCVLIGKKSVADSMCKRVSLNARKTFLRELILQKQAQRLMERM